MKPKQHSIVVKDDVRRNKVEPELHSRDIYSFEFECRWLVLEPYLIKIGETLPIGCKNV